MVDARPSGASCGRAPRQPRRCSRRATGAEGEERVGRRLEKLLRDRGVVVLHDLSVPGSRANIDHVCVGHGGVTVVDAKRYSGKVRIRRGALWVNGGNRTRLVEGVLRQIEVVRRVLASEGLTDIDIRGALCWVEDGGLPIIWHLSLDGVRIAWIRRIARLARRRGNLSPEDVERIVAALEKRLPPHRG
jgi:hypothetical protein